MFAQKKLLGGREIRARIVTLDLMKFRLFTRCTTLRPLKLHTVNISHCLALLDWLYIG